MSGNESSVPMCVNDVDFAGISLRCMVSEVATFPRAYDARSKAIPMVSILHGDQPQRRDSTPKDALKLHTRRVTEPVRDSCKSWGEKKPCVRRYSGRSLWCCLNVLSVLTRKGKAWCECVRL